MRRATGRALGEPPGSVFTSAGRPQAQARRPKTSALQRNPQLRSLVVEPLGQIRAI